MRAKELYVPEGWKHCLISDAFDTGRGRVINKNELEQNPGIYPVFSSQSTNDGEFGRIGTYDFEGEYITWTTDGANAGTVFYRNGRFNCTNVCGTLKIKSRFELDLKFISYSLGRYAKQYVSYVGNPKLMNNVMQLIPITFPTYSAQKRIAEVLESVDAAIETTRAVIEQTKKVKQGLLHTLLTQGIGHTKFKDSPLSKIPESWEVKKFGKVCKLQNGFAFKSTDFTDTGVPLIRISSIQDNGVTLEGAAYLPKDYYRDYSTFALQRGDILVAMSGATTGKLGVYDLAEPALLNQRVGRFNILDFNQLSRDFLQVAVEHIFKDVLAMAYGGAQPNISSKDLENYDIALPPLAEQQKLAGVMGAITQSAIDEASKLEALQQLKKGLLHDLLTGAVRTV